MNRPRLSVRLAGSPLGALLLFVLYVAIVLGWYQGNVPWWLALGAVAAAVRTLSAIGKVRRYKAWSADWQAAGAEDEPPRRQKRGKRGWVFVTGAGVLFVAIPTYLPQIRNIEAIPNALVTALTWLWVAACLLLVWKLLRLFWLVVSRSTARATARRRARAEAAPVAWLVACASSSPSRAAAEQNLPEYTARLIGVGG
jgi:hypothetical protein